MVRQRLSFQCVITVTWKAIIIAGAGVQHLGSDMALELQQKPDARDQDVG